MKREKLESFIGKKVEVDFNVHSEMTEMEAPHIGMLGVSINNPSSKWYYLRYTGAEHFAEGIEFRTSHVKSIQEIK